MENKKYNNTITDKGGWTDRDIVNMVEHNEVEEINAWNESEKKYIYERYAEIMKKHKALDEFHCLQNDDEDFKQTWGNTDENFEEWYKDNYLID